MEARCGSELPSRHPTSRSPDAGSTAIHDGSLASSSAIPSRSSQGCQAGSIGGSDADPESLPAVPIWVTVLGISLWARDTGSWNTFASRRAAELSRCGCRCRLRLRRHALAAPRDSRSPQGAAARRSRRSCSEAWSASSGAPWRESQPASAQHLSADHAYLLRRQQHHHPKEESAYEHERRRKHEVVYRTPAL